MKSAINAAVLALGSIVVVAAIVALLEQIRHRQRVLRRREAMRHLLPARSGEASGTAPLVGAATVHGAAAIPADAERQQRHAALETALQRMADPGAQTHLSTSPAWPDTVPMPLPTGVASSAPMTPASPFEKTQPLDMRTP